MEFSKKEIARDFLAIGSWVFYFLIIGRALIKPYRPFVDQLIIAGISLIIIGLIFKKSNNYLARGIILGFFTILFYNDIIFTIFAIIVLIGLGISLYFTDKKWKNIFKGAISGVIASGAGYYIANLMI